MTKAKLFEILDMEVPEDFAYFEQFADLVECEEEIDEELILKAISGMDGETAAELIENYFEDLTNAAPDDADDLVSLIDSVKQNMLLCTGNLDDINVKGELANQLAAFREWFHTDGKAKYGELPCSVFYAITEHRGDKLGNAEHKCDFSNALDYDLDNISLNLGAYSKVDIFDDEPDDESDETDEQNN